MCARGQIFAMLILSLTAVNSSNYFHLEEDPTQIAFRQKLLQWIENIYTNYLKSNDLIAIINEDLSCYNSTDAEILGEYLEYFHSNFNHPKVLYQYNVDNYGFDYYKKPDMYILFLLGPDFANIMHFLHSLDNWYPQAKFIIYYQGSHNNLPDLIEILYQHYVFEVVILMDTLQLYTYEPYNLENLYEPDLSIVHIGSVPEVAVFYDKKPLAWRNSSVVVTPVMLKPYVISIENKTGIDMDLMEVISEKMGLDLQYDTNPHYDWGWKHSNGTYVGVFRILQTQQTDFVNGHFHFRDPANLIDFDYTFSYTEDPLIWAVPCPVPISNWGAITFIFAKQTWYSVLVTLGISLLAWQIIGRIMENGTYFSSWYSIEVPFLLFLSLSIPTEPKMISTKMMYLSSWIFGFILTSSWLSYLTVSLTHLTYEKEIESVPEIFERGLILGIHPELAAMYGDSGDEIGQYIQEHFKECDLSGRCWDRVSYKKDMATITTVRILRYITYDKYMSEKGEQLMVIVKDAHVNMDYTVMFFVKGHPMGERVSQLLMWIREAGFIQYFDIHVNYKQAITNRRELFNPNQLETKMLNIDQMMASFLILVIGLPIAAIAFLFELCKRRSK